jgi:aryl-alcohol dehydrogenase-like predicted oxidoreductase/predicted kinase
VVTASSTIALGCMRLSTASTRDDVTSAALLTDALRRGVTFFDTAPVYAQNEADLHHNERLVARVIASSGLARSSVRIATKVGLTRVGTTWAPDGRASAIDALARESHAALGAIDLLFFYLADRKVPLETSVRALASLRETGIAAKIGLSDPSRAALDRARALTTIDALQLQLSPFETGALRSGLVSYAHELGLEVFAHSPFGGPKRAPRLAKNAILTRIAAALGGTPHAIVLAWLRAKGVTPLPGTTDLAHLEALARPLVLDDAIARELDALFDCAPPARVTSTARGEVVLIVGMQGAGKSTHAERLVETGFTRLNRDERGGTMKALHRALEAELASGVTRVVLDNTYPTRLSRADAIAHAHRAGLAARAIVLDVSIADAQVNAIDRMLARHGRLLDADAIAKVGKTDPNAFLPTAQHAYARDFEPVTPDEGFAAIEQRAFERRPIEGHEGAGVVVAVEAWSSARLAGASPTLVFAWSPPSRDAEHRDVLASLPPGVDVAQCPHAEGPPRCWCRPPLPGLVVPWLRARRIDPSKTKLFGTTSTHRALATALGLAYVAT